MLLLESEFEMLVLDALIDFLVATRHQISPPRAAVKARQSMRAKSWRRSRGFLKRNCEEGTPCCRRVSASCFCRGP